MMRYRCFSIRVRGGSTARAATSERPMRTASVACCSRPSGARGRGTQLFFGTKRVLFCILTHTARSTVSLSSNIYIIIECKIKKGISDSVVSRGTYRDGGSSKPEESI